MLRHPIADWLPSQEKFRVFAAPAGALLHAVHFFVLVHLGRDVFSYYLYGFLPLLSLFWAGLAWSYWNTDLPGSLAKPFSSLNRILVYTVPLAILINLCWFSEPIFSDDIYRYVFEGRVSAAGLNPFALAPRDPQLYPIASEIPNIWWQINNPRISAIYPPLAQFVFLVVAWGGGEVAMMRFVMAMVFVLGVLPATHRWMRQAGLPTGRLVALVNLPLLHLEIGVSGHLDVLVMMGGALCFCALAGGGKNRSGLPLAIGGLATAALSKLAPIVLLPHLAWQFPGWKRRILVLGALPLVCVGAYMPFANAGDGLFHASRIYSRHWEHNASLHWIMDAGLNRLDPGGGVTSKVLTTLGREEALYTEGWGWQHPNKLGARALSGILFGGLWIWMFWRRDRFETQWIVLIGCGLLLSPVVHPWYLLALLPAALRGGALSIPVFYWMLVVPMTYAALPAWWERNHWHLPAWAWWLEYGGLAVCAVAAFAWHRRQKGRLNADEREIRRRDSRRDCISLRFPGLRSDR